MPLVASSRRPLSLATAERSVSFLPLFRVLLLSRFSSLCCCYHCVQACGDSCRPAHRTLMPSSRASCSSRYERPSLCRVSYPVCQRYLFSMGIWPIGYFGQCLSLRLPSHFSGHSAHRRKVRVMTAPPRSLQPTASSASGLPEVAGVLESSPRRG